MIRSIGSSLGQNLHSTAKSTAGLDAQIAAYKKELSNCINCESAKTAKGKANIQNISNKIALLTEQVQQASPSQNANQLSSTNLITALENQSAITTIDNKNSAFSNSGDESIGNFLNVFA